jgi:superfamily II DNA/RNA helicase
MEIRKLINIGKIIPTVLQIKASQQVQEWKFDNVIKYKSIGPNLLSVCSVIALEAVDLTLSNLQVLVITLNETSAEKIMKDLKEFGVFLSIQCVNLSSASKGVDIKSASTLLSTIVSSSQVIVGSTKQVEKLSQSHLLTVKMVIIEEANNIMKNTALFSSLEKIFGRLPSTKRVVAISDNYTKSLVEKLETFLVSPKRSVISSHPRSLDGIKLYFSKAQESQTLYSKITELIRLLKNIQFTQCVVFCNDDSCHVELCTRLNEAGWPSSVISGPLDEKEHDTMMRALLSFHIRILITTDRTSLSIDLERINFTISLDIPKEFYALLFRVGRTSRFGIYGLSILIGTEQEYNNVNLLCDPYQVKFNLVPEPISSDLYTFITKEEIEESIDGKDDEDEKEKEIPTIVTKDQFTLNPNPAYIKDQISLPKATNASLSLINNITTTTIPTSVNTIIPTITLADNNNNNNTNNNNNIPKGKHMTNFDMSLSPPDNRRPSSSLSSISSTTTPVSSNLHSLSGNNNNSQLSSKINLNNREIDGEGGDEMKNEANLEIPEIHIHSLIDEINNDNSKNENIEEPNLNILDTLMQNNWPPPLPIAWLLESEEWSHPPNVFVKKRIKQWRADVHREISKHPPVINTPTDSVGREPLGVVSKVPPSYIAPLTESKLSNSDGRANFNNSHPQLMEKSYNYLSPSNKYNPSNYYYYDAGSEKKSD